MFWFVFFALLIAVVFKFLCSADVKEGFADVGQAISRDDAGVRNDCMVAEEDAAMRRLHRNMWMRGGNRIDDVANAQTKIIGAEINADTDKAQKKLTRDARRLALQQ